MAVGVIWLRAPELVERDGRLQLQQLPGIVLRPRLMHSHNRHRRHAKHLQAVAQDHVVGGTGAGTTAAVHDEPDQRQAEQDASSSSVIVEAIWCMQAIAVALAQIDELRVIVAAQQGADAGHTGDWIGLDWERKMVSEYTSKSIFLIECAVMQLSRKIK